MAVRHRRRGFALPHLHALLAASYLLSGTGCLKLWDDDDDTAIGDDDTTAGDDDVTTDDDDSGDDDDTFDPSWSDVLPEVDPEGDSGHASVDLMRYQFRHEDGALDLRAWSWTPFDDHDGDLTLRLCLRDPAQAYCLVHDNVSPVPSATQLWTTRDDLAIWTQLDLPATLAMDPDLAYSTVLGLELADTALEGCAFEGAAEVVDAGGSGDAAPDTAWTSGLWSPFELGDVLLLSLETVQLDDGSGGDGDGIPEPAETLALLPTVTNTGCGPSVGPGLRGELRLEPSSTAPASVVEMSVEFGGGGMVARGEEASPGEGLMVTLEPEAEPGQELHLSLDLVDDEGNEATLPLPSLRVAYPAQLATSEVLVDGEDAASPFDIAAVAYAITWTELQVRITSHQPHDADQEVDILLDVDTDGIPEHLLSTYDSISGAMTGAHYRAIDGAWVRQGPLALLDYNAGDSHALLGIDVAAVDRPGFAWVQAVSVDPASLATDRSPDDPADSAALGVIDFLAEPWIALLDRELTEVDGDGDPFPDPGETWSLRVQLANRGTVAGEPTRGTLSASSADLTVDSPSLSFGDVAAGGQAWSAETATLLIDPGADTTVVHEVSLAVDAGGVAAQLAVPLTLGPRPTDKAEDAALMGESGSWIGDLSVTTDDWRDTAGCTGSVAAGRDGVYLLELDAGQVVTAHVVYAAGVQDAVLYIGTDLADPAGTCLTGADDRDDETETLFWTAPAQGSYLLLVDGLHEDFGGEYVLTLSL